MAGTVTREVAEKDFNSWLDFKRVSDKKRDSLKEYSDKIINAIEEGRLVLNDNHEFVQTLSFDVNDEDGKPFISTLTYKPRVRVEVFHSQLKDVKQGDADRRILAYVAGLTNIPKAVIAKIDSEDYDICQSFAVFFL